MECPLAVMVICTKNGDLVKGHIMKTAVGNDAVRLYPLKENRYKLVGLLIAHARKLVHEYSSVATLVDASFNPDHPHKTDDPVKSAIKDYLSGKISLPAAG